MILLETESATVATKMLMSNTRAKPFIALRLKEAREAKLMSQPQLAAAAGMSQQGINEIEAGRVERPRKLVELARALDRTQEWLLGIEDGGDPAPPPPPPSNASFPPKFVKFSGRSVDLLGQSVAGPNGRFVLNGQKVGAVFCPPVLDGVDGAYAILVYGTSMEPKFEAGETVWLHPYLPVRRGDYVVAQIDAGDGSGEIDSYIKQFVSKTGSMLTLRQLNPDQGETELLDFPAEQVVSIHKVVFQQLL